MFSFDESTEISARFHRKVLRKDFFAKITFRKNVHADLYGYLDVNFVVSVSTPTLVILVFRISLSKKFIVKTLLSNFYENYFFEKYFSTTLKRLIPS